MQEVSPANPTDSIRRASLRAPLSGRSVESARSSSPRTRLSRKRAASLDLEATIQPRIEDLALDSVGTSTPLTSDSPREQLCLCQPDPKIPRPRNAFILYRQHYQAQVVAQHPGLANPEISKIIGEQWREQAPEVKNEWKRLAEEEKTRHSRQYPGYRYQPRRSAKGTGAKPASSLPSDDQLRCPKCNGRYISTPGTPLNPFPTSLSMAGGSRGESLQAPLTTSRRDEVVRPQYSASMQNSRMDTPRGAPQHPTMHRRTPYSHPQALPTHLEIEDDMELMSPEGSDLKRRRYNHETYRYNNDPPRSYASSPSSYSATQTFARTAPLPISAGVYRQQHLPPTPGHLSRSGFMGPGPPPSHVSANQQSRHPYTAEQAPFDESLRLPPLQTHVSAASPDYARSDIRTETRNSQAKSVEAMVMTIPYVNKIKVLAKISPPLAAPGPTSPPVNTRGPAIAIEGSERELLTEIGTFIEVQLRKETSCSLRVWDGHNTLPQDASIPTADTQMGNTGGPTQADDAFPEYLSKISSWHKKSQEMTKHITTLPSLPSTSRSAKPSDAAKSKLIPIALVRNGFSLTTSDKYALIIPINDSYAPIDHWQWMATLWRGIIGPDLTLYITRADKKDIARHGGVEIRKDCAAIIVRVLEGCKMEEKTARRLAFEVMEFVRGGEAGFGVNN
ncbi:hypothetical protein BJ875DRAFT_441815 [Amylocarpus encephaloides]|uniref:HMG box domain-containing protein n=1 Tax=Amylocarpus encephaloides TaxID=45428 RepID=A0A9P7YI76_9HELO|nr:hypothetical protein BJ875DRAFT_441815 [Amylocarpus encephaloides]